jgi:hypothetical protein
MMGQTKVGTYTGTGAAINVQIGFVPDYLRIVNITDGDYTMEWFNGMAAGTSIDTAAAVATNAADGITAYNGTRGGDGAGFTVGTDGSETGKVYRYFAVADQ